MKNEIENIINKSIDSVKKLENIIEYNNLILNKANCKLIRKNKLKKKLDDLIEEQKIDFTYKELFKINQSRDLLEKEILLINKKKLKIEKELCTSKLNLKKVVLDLNENGITVNDENILESLVNEKYKIYTLKFQENKYKGDMITRELYYELSIGKYSSIYILDTNIFIDEPKILNYINHDILIVISKTVIDELDFNKHKKEIAYNVREAIRNISNYKGSNIIFAQANKNLLPQEYKINGDNLILSVAIQFKEFDPIIITNDIAFNIKARMEGIVTNKLNDILY